MTAGQAMPFTISHAAAVLPFSRFLARRRVLSAALIGSMVPDFGWFTPWRPTRFETHSVIGLLAFCLPAGLAAFWVFQRLIKTPLIELLPDGAYARWRAIAAPADYTDPMQWIWASCGLRRGSGTPGAPARPLSTGERRLWIGGFVLAAAMLSGAFFLMNHPAESATRGLGIPLSGAAIAVLRGRDTGRQRVPEAAPASALTIVRPAARRIARGG